MHMKMQILKNNNYRKTKESKKMDFEKIINEQVGHNHCADAMAWEEYNGKIVGNLLGSYYSSNDEQYN